MALGRIEGHCRNRPRNRRPGQAGYKGYIQGYTRLRQEMKPGPAVARTLGRPARPKPVPQQPGRSQVDHICYTIPNWNDQRLMAALTAAGTKPVDRTPGGGSINVFDPNNYQVQLASIQGENAWRK